MTASTQMLGANEIATSMEQKLTLSNPQDDSNPVDNKFSVVFYKEFNAVELFNDMELDLGEDEYDDFETEGLTDDDDFDCGEDCGNDCGNSCGNSCHTFKSSSTHAEGSTSSLIGDAADSTDENFWNLSLDTVVSATCKTASKINLKNVQRSSSVTFGDKVQVRTWRRTTSQEFESTELESKELEEQKLMGQKKEEISKKKKNLSVKFDKVYVRTYERILADNTCRTGGPSLGIGWAHGETDCFNFKDWEHLQTLKYKSKTPKQPIIILSAAKRERLARELGYSTKEIAENVRTGAKLNRQRLRTLSNLNAQTVEETVENTVRKIKKLAFPHGTRKSLTKFIPSIISEKKVAAF